MIVTFDSNVWRKVASPNNFQKDPNHAVNLKLNSLVKQNAINAFLSETIFTLEAIKKVDRHDVFKIYRPNIEEKVDDDSMNSGFIKVQFKIGPGKNNQPILNDFLREHLTDAISAGFKIIHLPRIGGFVNEEVKKHTVKFSEEELKNYLDKVFMVAKRIEELNCGFAWIEKIGIKYDVNAVNGIGKAPDSENNNIIKAVAEWADGDTVACAVAIGSNYICTNDEAKSAGSNSVFSKQNIEILKTEYGFELIKPEDLANKF
jgi:hypothetical protein